jgi:hypothetical protein
MATKSTKKAIKTVSKKTAVKVAAKKSAKTPNTAKKLAESKPVKKPVRRPAKPAEPVPAKVLAVDNGESNVKVSTTKPGAVTELDKAKAVGQVVEAPDSITPEQAEKIAETRVTHEDERPPTKLSVPEIFSIAWELVKTPGDPPFSQCVGSHVDKFYSHGQAILKGNSPQEGSTQLARFERAVSRLTKEK